MSDIKWTHVATVYSASAADAYCATCGMMGIDPIGRMAKDHPAKNVIHLLGDGDTYSDREYSPEWVGVVAKMEYISILDGWCIFKAKHPEWTEWKTFVPAPWSDREYRMGIDGSVEYRDKKNV